MIVVVCGSELKAGGVDAAVRVETGDIYIMIISMALVSVSIMDRDIGISSLDIETLLSPEPVL